MSLIAEEPNTLHPENAYWDGRLQGYIRTVQPGEFAIASEPDHLLGTLLGSCVSACICDPTRGIGGLNHFLLPSAGIAAHEDPPRASRYGVYAMEMLINALLKSGTRKNNLQAKLFGGAHLMSANVSDSVGKRNQQFALEFLECEGIPVVAEDFGGHHARRIFFRPSTNKVLMVIPENPDVAALAVAESRLQTRLSEEEHAGDVELFSE